MKLKRIIALALCLMMLITNVFAQDVLIDLGSTFTETEEVEVTDTEATKTEATDTEATETVVPDTEATDSEATDKEADEPLTEGENSVSSEEAQPENENKSYFTDVPADSQYAEAITKMVESGIIDGYGDNTFRPENGVTRAEMCKMINLTFNYVKYDKAAGFPDISAEQWHAPYVLAAQQEGYVEGYEDGTFRPDNNITRQEVCVIINRIVKPMNLGLNVTINDEVSDWAKEAVELVVMNNLMPLEENNTFRAKESIKRYELAALLSLFVVPPAEPLTAEVRFFNGETQLGETDTVLIGDYPTVPEAPAPVDDSYKFVGWRVVGQSEICDAANTMIVDNTDYEAVYEKKTFKVEFYDGATLFNSLTVEYGDSPVEPETEPETAGYDFLGWSLEEGGETVYVDDLVIVSDTILYAVFKKSVTGGGPGGGGPGGGDSGDDDDEPQEKVYYDVYFFVNEDIHATQSVLKGANPKKPADPELDGDIFLGWSLKENGDEDDVVDVTDYVVKDYTDFYAVIKSNPNDPELIPMLEKGIEQLNSISLTNNKHKTARGEMVYCMKLVLADAKSGIYVDKAYVSEVYAEEVEYVESLVLDEMTGREGTEFKNLITKNVDEDVQEFLKEYFLNGEDISV